MGLTSAFKDFVRGALMGAAEIVPGVSGGTIALIVGVYEQLIGAISHAASGVVHLARGDVSGLFGELRAIEWRLLIPLMIGMLCMVVIGARFIRGILEVYPVESRALFFGLITGSLLIPWRRIERRNLRTVVLAALAAIAAFFIVSLPAAEIAQPGLAYVFLGAAVAICALILPGVSGSYFLYIFGIYHATLEAINTLDAAYVAVFLAGAAVGLGTFSRPLSFLLKHYYDATMAVLVGLMIGSLRALWPWLGEDRSLELPQATDPILSVVALILAGAGFVLALYFLALPRDENQGAQRNQSASNMELSEKAES